MGSTSGRLEFFAACYPDQDVKPRQRPFPGEEKGLPMAYEEATVPAEVAGQAKMQNRFA